MAKTTKQGMYENSAVDKKLDKAQAKKGIKEGSKKDLAVDKKMMGKMNTKKGKK